MFPHSQSLVSANAQNSSIAPDLTFRLLLIWLEVEILYLLLPNLSSSIVFVHYFLFFIFEILLGYWIWQFIPTISSGMIVFLTSSFLLVGFIQYRISVFMKGNVCQQIGLCSVCQDLLTSIINQEVSRVSSKTILFLLT